MKKILIILASVFLISLVSASLNVQLSDQGTGVSYSNGTTLSLGDLSVLIYDASSGGNLIYNETFTNNITDGSWNVMLGSGSVNLPLEFGRIYYKDYLIAGEDATFDGQNRQAFYSPLGDVNANDLASGINLSDATGYLYGNLVGAPSGTSDQWNITTSNYLFNQSGILYINETKLNNTIDNRISSQGINASFNQTLTDTLYLPNGTNLDLGANNITTTGTGFFGWLGSLVNRITTLFVRDIDFNGTITGKGLNASNDTINTLTISASDGNIVTSGNVTAGYFVGDGSGLTNLPAGSLGISINPKNPVPVVVMFLSPNSILVPFSKYKSSVRV